MEDKSQHELQSMADYVDSYDKESLAVRANSPSFLLSPDVKKSLTSSQATFAGMYNSAENNLFSQSANHSYGFDPTVMGSQAVAKANSAYAKQTGSKFSDQEFANDMNENNDFGKNMSESTYHEYKRTLKRNHWKAIQQANDDHQATMRESLRMKRPYIIRMQRQARLRTTRIQHQAQLRAIRARRNSSRRRSRHMTLS